MKENYLGVDVSPLNYDELISALYKRLEEQQNSFIVAINPEKIMKARQDEELRTLLNRADFQIPDGIGVILASKLKGGSINSRVTGIDMMMRICEESVKRNKSVFLFGAKPGIAEEAQASLERLYPGIRVAGTLNGYEKDPDVIRQTINDAKPDILFVAMGSPAQEYFIVNNMSELHPHIFQGVGGSFDVLSGRIKRAPQAFQRLGLEWFYRLLKEPKRIKRQLILPKFLISVLKK
ncbi:WecB/TagA/CpsF family glycosyltransferase [Jeotgalibacillus terrae]|uniref:N-acetylglucosaminyldiphosphoundecaprenol N-acetyl-beta-D-mannosaminyltransferase n=1 Tax=Jeotgalibacillus terrae TaxID=587735 RepID=A0ABW5ZFT6_9BACL|nr:WecB/TagA/CpsF family glycosyltransferase [Jeotgalibacillus terrae]MBM7577886.1 N-acetylglucosaminyldiphosphoundecaprenol N-acetyl-beta-D-mannosaminyltransferase [Jeotgalibacillus terrae]